LKKGADYKSAKKNTVMHRSQTHKRSENLEKNKGPVMHPAAKNVRRIEGPRKEESKRKSFRVKPIMSRLKNKRRQEDEYEICMTAKIDDNSSTASILRKRR